jgi:hypothetical protein
MDAPRRPVVFPFVSRRSLRALTGAILVLAIVGGTWGSAAAHVTVDRAGGPSSPRAATSAAVGNFTAAINRLVDLVGLAGGGILALVWARVALSWFSNDVTKKVQAKDRARDALIGTLLFTAAITGLFWGLAHWVLTGS